MTRCIFLDSLVDELMLLQVDWIVSVVLLIECWCLSYSHTGKELGGCSRKEKVEKREPTTALTSLMHRDHTPLTLLVVSPDEVL